MPTVNQFDCPNCQTSLVAGAPACPSCHMRLTGPEAARLWQVDRQIAVLHAERDRLLAVLTAPVPARVGAQAAAGPDRFKAEEFPPYPVYPRYAVAQRPPATRKGIPAQQLLLGVGALLLLSAAAFFLLVAWLLVGVVGQSMIMLVLTLAAVAGAALATRRRLPAAAETAAVIGSGLVLIDLAGARWLGLAGLDSIPTVHYWTFASARSPACSCSEPTR